MTSSKGSRRITFNLWAWLVRWASCQRRQDKIRGANILIYALADGKLTGVDIKDKESTLSRVSADNHINVAVYRLKARDIMAGKSPTGPPSPPEINEFQNTLTRISKQ
jgi:hypothetical protein